MNTVITSSGLFEQLLVNFLSMNNGETYRPTEEALGRINKARGKQSYKPAGNVVFVRNDNSLSVNEKVVIQDMTELSSMEDFAFAFAFALSFALSLALSFALGELEKIETDSCDGKVVEIDGKKYQLSLVSNKGTSNV